MSDVLKVPEAARALGCTEACARAIVKGQVWDESDVAAHLGIEVSQVKELAERPDFPFSRQFGKRSRRWLSDNFEGFALESLPQRNPGQCALYFHYEKRTLLYVGISLSAIARLREHIRGSHWSDEITTVRIKKYATVEKARAAEVRAIKSMRPLHNIVHNRNRDNA